jgi:type II secretory pathway component PulF
MPTYKYESKNSAGKVSTGVLTAANLAAASQQLRARGEFISRCNRRTPARARRAVSA